MAKKKEMDTTPGLPELSHTGTADITTHLRKCRRVKVRITFQEELLGSCAANPDVHRQWIASRGENADAEVDALPQMTEEEMKSGVSVFQRFGKDRGDDGKEIEVLPELKGLPVIFPYVIKGFLKAAASALAKVPGSFSSEQQAYLKSITHLVFPGVGARPIPIHFPDGFQPERNERGEIVLPRCERPIKATSAQGVRVALKASEAVPAGSWLETEIMWMDTKLDDFILELLDYGLFHGLGEWRNSGRGRFKWQMIPM